MLQTNRNMFRHALGFVPSSAVFFFFEKTGSGPPRFQPRNTDLINRCRSLRRQSYIIGSDLFLPISYIIVFDCPPNSWQSARKRGVRLQKQPPKSRKHASPAEKPMRARDLPKLTISEKGQKLITEKQFLSARGRKPDLDPFPANFVISQTDWRQERCQITSTSQVTEQLSQCYVTVPPYFVHGKSR